MNISKVSKRCQVFTLPGEEDMLESILNNDLCDVTQKIVNYNAKQCIYQVYLEWDDYREDTSDFSE